MSVGIDLLLDFNVTTTSIFQTKMDSQIEASVRYIERILQMSFVMTRQPDDINVMQTPSTHRIVSKVSLVLLNLPEFFVYDTSCTFCNFLEISNGMSH